MVAFFEGKLHADNHGFHRGGFYAALVVQHAVADFGRDVRMKPVTAEELEADVVIAALHIGVADLRAKVEPGGRRLLGNCARRNCHGGRSEHRN